MSTRDVARFIEGMFGTQYSPTTVSNITSTVLEDVQRWQERPLEKRYSVIYLDGFYFNLKRDTYTNFLTLPETVDSIRNFIHKTRFEPGF
ncbi:hypothetical protein ASG89_33965 [Paenibacillus sp. Soil766]|uniref:transposase n=1 Tax=Paenibacillus sp. Soil766 TaxID=1736404 RepID=UPI00070D1156|nr:transposase [Paenibacillus sp. Soil766]KRE92064.1 hypothetical protein ASG89_33965 [Paenibacillus sp. Soil766]